MELFQYQRSKLLIYPFFDSSFKILCIGDSYTVGGAVASKDSYPSQLQKRLSKEFGNKFRVINGEGYTITYLPTGDIVNVNKTKLSEDLGKIENIIISFSINTPRVSKKWENGAADPLSRIKANKKVAEIYFKTGNLTLALDMFKELPIEEGDLEDLYSIMQALVNNEEFASAQIAAELILGVNPDYRDTAEILESLRSREREHLGINAQGDEMQALIGEHSVGRYQLIRKIASGGMGVIYKVYDKKLGKCAAMKILREELSGSDRALERFFREARIAASIKHPNIVDIYDFNISHTAGQSFISMEYIEGRSLREIIEEKFAFSPEPTPAYMAQILYYMSQLCSVLEATHKKGIIHRDIKPDNIFGSSCPVTSPKPSALFRSALPSISTFVTSPFMTVASSSSESSLQRASSMSIMTTS